MRDLNDFSWALTQLKAGHRVTRQEWKEKYPSPRTPWLQIFADNNYISLCSPIIAKPDVWRVDPVTIMQNDWLFS